MQLHTRERTLIDTRGEPARSPVRCRKEGLQVYLLAYTPVVAYCVGYPSNVGVGVLDGGPFREP